MSAAPNSWQSEIAVLEDNVFEKKLLPEDSPLAEKRKESRASVSVPLNYRLKGKSNKWHDAESVDISNTGVRLAMAIPALVGTNIELDVRFPAPQKNIHVEGVVVWVAPSPRQDQMFECGVAFENLRRVTKKDKLIHFIANRLCDTAAKESIANEDCHLVKNFEELKAAYRLIYQEYSRRGYCNPNPSELHYTPYSLLPDSRTFVMAPKGRVLGTLSLIVDSPCGLPMEYLFHSQINKLRGEGRVLAEVSLLALDQEAFRKRSFSLTDFQKMTGSFRLFKMLFDYALYLGGVTDLVIAVHPKHEELYRYLTFEVMAAAKPYSTACGKLALPFSMDIQKNIKKLPPDASLGRYFIHQTTPLETLGKGFRWDGNLLREFLHETNPAFLGELSDAQRRFLKKSYPEVDSTT